MKGLKKLHAKWKIQYHGKCKNCKNLGSDLMGQMRARVRMNSLYWGVLEPMSTIIEMWNLIR